MVKVSVIVCVYNAEQYIGRCISSILSQTYKNYDLIVVNDGSTDKSIKICRELCAGSDNYTIFEKENGGLVSARKLGVSNAKGEYICCVDADDWIESDYLQHLVDYQGQYDVDIVSTGHYRDIGNTQKVKIDYINKGIYSVSELIDTMMFSGIFYIPGILQYFHGKLFRSSILKKVQLLVDNRIGMGEDVAVIYPAISIANSLYADSYCGYHYVSNPNSMVATIRENEAYELKILTDYLYTFWKNSKYSNSMNNQISMFNKCSMLTRCIEEIDKNKCGNDKQEILYSYGRICKNSRIVLYGAGILGQRIKRYCIDSNNLELVKWVDKEFVQYREYDMDVENPDSMSKLDESEYDYVVIALTDGNVAKIVTEYLTNHLLIKKEKILWLSDEYIFQ